MHPRPSLLRAAQLTCRQTRTSPFRSTIQRRFDSHHPPTKLEGAMDNEFNRERRAVKEHAKSSTELWRKMCYYVVIPALILASINAKNLWDDHWEHWEHMPPLEERVEYPYMNIRTKAYPWGNGDQTLFWNPKVNYHHRD